MLVLQPHTQQDLEQKLETYSNDKENLGRHGHLKMAVVACPDVRDDPQELDAEDQEVEDPKREENDEPVPFGVLVQAQGQEDEEQKREEPGHDHFGCKRHDEKYIWP